MLEGQGMVLKGRVEIGQREMAGIIRLGRETKVREPEPADEEGLFAQGRSGGPAGPSGVRGHQPEQGQEAEGEGREEPGPARHLNRGS